MRDAMIWHGGAIEHDIVTALDQQGREILDIEVADQVGAVFDIYPDKQLVRMLGRQLVKAGPVIGTDVAPGRAQAGHDPDVVLHALRELLLVMRF